MTRNLFSIIYHGLRSGKGRNGNNSRLSTISESPPPSPSTVVSNTDGHDNSSTITTNNTGVVGRIPCDSGVGQRDLTKAARTSYQRAARRQ